MAELTPAVRPRGFPDRFPVHDDLHRPWRYSAVAASGRLAARVIFGRQIRIEGVENVPAEGPLLICANHLSNLDPMIMGSFTPGANSAMAKRELFANPALAWLWAGCNVFPVDRGTADRWAMRTALDILKRGGRLMLWVEGTRALRPGMKRAEPGVGFLWRKCPVPILPVAVSGTEAALVKGRRLPRRVPALVRFGTPQELHVEGPAARDNQAVADRIATMIAALLPEEYRGVYAEAAAAAPGTTR